MTDLIEQNPSDVDRHEPSDAPAPFDWEPRVLSISARFGAWGLCAGIGGVLIDIVSIGSSWGFLLPVAGAGFILGGLGTMATSALVLRRVRHSFRRLTLAAAIGIPFGLASTFIGLKIFFPLFLDGLFSYALSAVLVLSTVLVVLLGIGIVEKLWTSRGPAPRDEPD